MNERKSHIAVARQQMTTAGLTVLDREVIYQASPSMWASTQEALLTGNSVRSMLSALMVDFPTATYFEAVLGGKTVLGMARTLANIEQRLEWLTGQKATAIKPIAQPLSALHQEQTRVQEVKQEAPDEFAGFDLAEHIVSMPRHPCHNRVTAMDRLERFWLLHPENFRKDVYLTDEIQRLETFREKLIQAFPDMEFDTTHTPASYHL